MDLLQRAISSDHRLRALAAVTTDLVREACRRHEVTGAEAVVLGRALTVGCLLCTLTKSDKERVRLEFRGDGPLGKVMVDCRSGGQVRGFIQLPEEFEAQPLPDVIGGRRRVGALVGDGTLMITRDLGLERAYQGIVALTTGEIDEDIEHYLDSSEQMPSALGAEVVLDAQGGVLRSAGVLLQTFPGGTPAEVGGLRTSLFGGNLADLLRQERTPAELVGFALSGRDHDPLEPSPLVFRCHCDPARARAILSTLGADDLDDLADEPGATEVRCSYCGARYSLTPAELHALAAELRADRS
ncbi:MAG: Hsp33 family molecular chaperone HslO [Nannocystaceae bacterium]